MNLIFVALGLLGLFLPTEGQLLFSDDFDTLDLKVWTHQVSGWRGGNNEFQYYRNDRRNSYVRDGILYILPTFTATEYGDEFLENGTLSYADCNMEPCASTGRPNGDIVLPIQSARIYTKGAFSFKYGRVEVRAKIPRGDWLWPAIWMMPAQDVYGTWPKSGEVDILESRGNDKLFDREGKPQGIQKVGSTLHFGTNWDRDAYQKADWHSTLEKGSYADDFHIYAIEWNERGFRWTVDDKEFGSVVVPEGGFWELGEFDKLQSAQNIWANGTRMAPFDQEFYVMINLAVGGGFFPAHLQNQPNTRPWGESDFVLRDFWKRRDWWLPTWSGENAALQVDYVKVYQC